MQLPGRLSASTLGDLLGALHRGRATGALELVETASARGTTVPGRTHRIQLVDGLVVAVESDVPVPRIGEILRGQGRLDARTIGRLLVQLASGDARPAGAILVEDGGVPPELVDAALRTQLRAKLEPLYGLEDAVVRFRAPRARAGRRPTPLSPREFLDGRPRARDRVRGPRSVPPPEPRDEAQVSDLDDDAARRALGLGPSAGRDEVRRAFRKLAARLHPDKLVAASDAERAKSAAELARLSAAYHRLVA